MSGPYVVVTSPAFDRLLKRLAARHPDLPEVLASAVGILSADPYNRSRRQAIKKLRGTAPGEGQYRLRIAQWRFRYDVWSEKREVELSYCGLRREETYR